MHTAEHLERAKIPSLRFESRIHIDCVKLVFCFEGRHYVFGWRLFLSGAPAFSPLLNNLRLWSGRIGPRVQQ